MDVSPISVGELRAELALYPDDAAVDVLVPDGPGSFRVLRVVEAGLGGIGPDDGLDSTFALVTEPLPEL